MSKSDYAENAVNDWITGKTTMPATTTRYVALFTAAPSDSGGGTEVTGGSYARKSTAGADWNASSAGSVSNANTITFVTASASWGTVTHFGVFDASTAGNLLFWGALTNSKTIGTGDTASFAGGTPGALVHTED
jgi:hypothetical protein